MITKPFKAGDKVVRCEKYRDGLFGGEVYTVARVDYDNAGWADLYLQSAPPGANPAGAWNSFKFRAAIAGQDYPAPPRWHADPPDDRYQGHLPDGSSVQAHSAGGLYPVVLVYRDKPSGPDADGKYDVGVISPKNQDPIWFKSSDAAIAVAEAIKANL